MKRMILSAMICVLCAAILVSGLTMPAQACEYTNFSSDATSPVCSQHNWVRGINTSGIHGWICAECLEVELDTYEWTPLTDCEKIMASNEEAHFQDVVVGDWDTRSGELPDALRFCVSGKESYKRTHYIIYNLHGDFNTLSGLVSFMDKSDKYATARILIYLDNELAYESDTFCARSGDETFMLDVSGVNMVRVVCSTQDKHTAYCALSASVY